MAEYQVSHVKLALGVVRQQAFTSGNVDRELCRHMTSLSHNELTLAKELLIIYMQCLKLNL